MNCPSCGLRQDDKAKECAGCQVNFSHWREVQSRREMDGYSAPTSKRAAGARGYKKHPWRWIAGLAFGLGAALWLFFPRKGLPIPEGAFLDFDRGFAILPSPGWNHSSPGTRKGRFIEAFSMLKSVPEGRTPPVLNVVVTESPVPPMTDLLKDRAARIVEAELKGVFDRYTRQKVRIIEVDRLKTLQITGIGQKNVVVAPAVYKHILRGTVKIMVKPETTRSLELKVISLIVPGSERGYLLTCMSDLADYAALEGDFASAVGSFRVLAHPLPLASVLRGWLKYSIMALLAFLSTVSLIKIRRWYK